MALLLCMQNGENGQLDLSRNGDYVHWVSSEEGCVAPHAWDSHGKSYRKLVDSTDYNVLVDFCNRLMERVELLEKLVGDPKRCLDAQSVPLREDAPDLSAPIGHDERDAIVGPCSDQDMLAALQRACIAYPGIETLQQLHVDELVQDHNSLDSSMIALITEMLVGQFSREYRLDRGDESREVVEYAVICKDGHAQLRVVETIDGRGFGPHVDVSTTKKGAWHLDDHCDGCVVCLTLSQFKCTKNQSLHGEPHTSETEGAIDERLTFELDDDNSLKGGWTLF